jgi:hypothetical protein
MLLQVGNMIFLFSCPRCGLLRGSSINPELLSELQRLCRDCFKTLYYRRGNLIIRRKRSMLAWQARSLILKKRVYQFPNQNHDRSKCFSAVVYVSVFRIVVSHPVNFFHVRGFDERSRCKGLSDREEKWQESVFLY